MFGNTAFWSSTIDLTNLQNLGGNEMIPSVSAAIWPFPNVKSWLWNLAAVAVPAKRTLLFVWSRKIVKCCNSLDDFKHALSSSAGVLLWPTGNFCRKLPTKITMTPPITFEFPLKSLSVVSRASVSLLCAIVHSSQAITSYWGSSWRNPEFLLILFLLLWYYFRIFNPVLKIFSIKKHSLPVS